MPNQNRNNRKPPQRLFIRVFEDGCIGGGYSYCLNPPVGFDSVEYAQVVTNQNECCHMHGIRYGEGEGEEILWGSENVLHEIKRSGERWIEKFNYCPHCGAKIDWDKIKEEVDAKQNQ